ncbi:hypothetical protein HBB16_10560 [Pseudonocardia sp. MCCB 268]|nr:hypothetical protein [Pseudonocardia cytotoxica]
MKVVQPRRRVGGGRWSRSGRRPGDPGRPRRRRGRGDGPSAPTSRSSSSRASSRRTHADLQSHLWTFDLPSCKGISPGHAELAKYQ